jgi:hypothetical protein
LMLRIASSGMAVLPSLRMGVTSASSQTMGTCGSAGAPQANAPWQPSRSRARCRRSRDRYLGVRHLPLALSPRLTVTGDEGDGVVALPVSETPGLENAAARALGYSRWRPSAGRRRR